MSGHIAVVDDDALNLKVAGHILSKNGMEVSQLSSGQALLGFVEDNTPDLVLLDIKMPDMDGFETLAKLRTYEESKGMDEIPVIFLTADEDVESETHGFEMGVADFIRKPFDPEVLMRRIENVLNRQGQITRYQKEANTDKMTGLLNKSAVTEKIENVCRSAAGYLMMIDLDSFKLVNDLYGHDLGDEVLIAFADLTRANTTEQDILGRVGGDEFMVFATSFRSEDDIAEFSEKMNAGILSEAKRLLGEDMDIPLGISIGVKVVPGDGTDPKQLMKNADKALYYVKLNGRHGYCIYDVFEDDGDESGSVNLKTLSMLLSERNISDSALMLDMDSSTAVYRYVIRYIKRYHKDACKVLFTLTSDNEDEAFDRACEEFGDAVSARLRKSDIILPCRKNQFFVFLTRIREDSIDLVIEDIIGSWRDKHGYGITIDYEVEFLGSGDDDSGKNRRRTDREQP